ncbi:MAG: hypothetical protein ACRBCI_02120 [Cellvibrionaceae bacterium]
MGFSSANCNSSIELAILSLAIISALTFMASAFVVFTNEEANEEKSWWVVLQFWLYPLRPIYTSKGLNSLGKKWRPVFIISLACCLSLVLLMYFTGMCHTKI